jgi:hypothetical protein
MLLVSDAASLTTRRLHRFAGASEASDFVRFWFPPDKRGGLIAFWALSDQPLDTTFEVVVLVRDARDAGLVYPFSFLHIDAALDFVRDEWARGLDPALVSVAYAVPVSIERHPVEADAIWITPPSLPATLRPRPRPVSETAWSYRLDTPAVSERPEVFPDDLIDSVLRALRRRRWGVHPLPFAGFGSPPGRF